MQQSPKLLYVGALPTHFAIFSNTLGEGSERSLIGKTTAYEQKTFSSNLNQRLK